MVQGTNYKIPGRVRSDLSCDSTLGDHFELATVTGSIASAHPHSAQLLANGVNDLSGADAHMWGIELNNQFRIGG